VAVTIGYHVSHEQFAPSELLRLAQRAERAGFGALLSSDHFHPWTRAQGQSGYAWSWLGAALATTKLACGVVTAPGQRYHPAIVAQALATLAEMFPGRIWAALGSGQALNESITGQVWPSKQRRNQRLLESAHVIRALLRGETVTHHGLVEVELATLFTRPASTPTLLAAAGSWADGLITTSRPRRELAALVAAFRAGGGDGKPMYLKVQLSYDPNEQRARAGAHAQWAANIFPSAVLADLRSPAQFEQLAAQVGPAELDAHVRVSSDLARHAAWLAEDLELGFSHVYLHNVNTAQAAFIEAFGEHVLPALLK
jgi:coenzyme F420-dependent glucose-6-phosphate dehydrogenase